MNPAVNPTSAPTAAASAPIKRKKIGPTPEEMQQQLQQEQQQREQAQSGMPSPTLAAPPGLRKEGREALAAVPTTPPADASQAAPSSAPPAARGSVVNPTWQTYFNSRLAQLGPNATSQQLEALKAEADSKITPFADANQVVNATPEMRNQSNAHAAAMMEANAANRGRTVPQTPLLTPRTTSAPPAAAAPMFPPNAAAAGMANAINDGRNGITSRGGGVTTTEKGGIIQTAPGGVKTASSPYGRTGAGAGAAGYSIDTGKMGPGDANLRAQTDAMKGRQAQGIFSPAPPTVAASPAAMAPKPAAAPLTAAAPPVARPNAARPGVPLSSSLNAAPAGSTAANVMGNTPARPAPTAAPYNTAAPKPTNTAIALLGQPVIDNLDKGSNYIPYTSARTPAPAPVASSAPPRATGSAPAGGWMNLAKSNFNQSMAGEIVDMTTTKAKQVASSVGGAVKAGYATAGRAFMPMVQPALNQAKANLAASTLGKALGVAPPMARAKGGPVTAGQPYLVGEKGPEVVVPKIDSLESVSRKGSLQNGIDTNPRPRSADSDFNKWFQGLQKRELESEIANRPAGHQQMEQDMGLTPSSERMTGYPKTGWEDAKAGFDEGVTQIGKTAAALGSWLPGNVGKEYEKRRQLYDERGQIIADYRARSPVNKAAYVTPGGLAKTAVTTIPELFNPVNKPGMVAKGVNATWHAARGYLPDKSPKDAAISSLSSIVGEKAEDLVTKGKGLVGNTVGTLTENVAQRSQPYVVGERGPEVIVPQASGTVIPNHKLPGGYPITAAAPPMARPSNTRPGVPVSAGLPKGRTVPKMTSAPPVPLAALR